MVKLISLIKWIWNVTWPALLLATIFILHVSSVSYLDTPTSEIHKLVALCTQVIGGVLILYSIDSNIGIYKKQNLISLYWANLKTCPLLKKQKKTTRHSSSSSILGLSGSNTSHKKPETVEEKIALLEIQIGELRQELRGNHSKLANNISQLSQELTKEIQKTNTTLSTLNYKVEEASTGGISIQIFGFMLMVYGAFSGYIS